MTSFPDECPPRISARRPRRPHRPRRLRLLIGLLLAGVLGAALAAGVVTASAAPGPLVVPGAGRWMPGHGAFVGYYRAQVAGRWVKVYCVSPDRRAPSRITLSTLSRVPATSLTVSRELAETLSAHGDARNAAEAEAVSQALNYEIGHRAAVRQRARHLGRAVAARAMRYVAEARQLRGRVELRLQLPASPLPGQRATASVSLRGEHGGRVATVRLSHGANVSTPRSVRTDAGGRARFTYRTTGVGRVDIAAAVTGRTPVTLRSSTPASSTQRMLSWSPPTRARAAASYRGAVAGFADRYSCSSVCDGHPVVTLSACAPAGSYPSRLTYRFAGRAQAIDFAAARTRTCRTWSTQVADGERVTGSWQFRGPQGWTAAVPAAGSFTVDCPPAPSVVVLAGVDCAAGTVTAELGRVVGATVVPTRNTTAHRMVLVVAGARSARSTLAPGAIARPLTYAVACRASGRAGGSGGTTISVQGGVQRGDGAYNYGRVTTVLIP